jgi:hypothetical protein
LTELTLDERAELETLRARVGELERERAEQVALANAAIAALQARVYWLDRWHLDLNALMGRPGAAELRAGVRIIRAMIRQVRLVTRRLLG